MFKANEQFVHIDSIVAPRKTDDKPICAGKEEEQAADGRSPCAKQQINKIF